MSDVGNSDQQLAQAPRLECDIVMAGGVTSGIIYPGAAAMIARRYTFRSIGGTSVGAIAAAVTAAAEYGRLTGANPTSFDELARVPKSLGEQASDGHSRLFHLFTPEAPTRPLLALVMPLFGQGSFLKRLGRVVFESVTTNPLIGIPFAVMLLAGAAASVSLFIHGHCLLGLVAIVMTLASLVVTWGAAVGLLLAFRWLPAWRKNGFGICTGLATPAAQPGQTGQQAYAGLTEWIHANVQRAAGRGIADRPVTFGDLWSAPLAPGATVTEADPAKPRTIELSMIASDISRNRTVQLPFIETPSPLYVEVETLKRYFPESVCAWMVAQEGPRDSRIDTDRIVVRLPPPQDLPVVFGARLSLSFPVLLSAIPLMTLDFAKARKGRSKIPLRHVWFSDGGLTSNFPIHFFDSPIPTRPTFCFNLVDYDAAVENVDVPDDEADADEGTSNSDIDASKAIAEPRADKRRAADATSTTDQEPPTGHAVWDYVSMPKGNKVVPALFTAFDRAPGAGIGSFFSALLNTARFWSDNQLLMAPGVRDRVVNIALRENEGGLNLDMPASVISDLDFRGRAAGLLISARFDPERETDPETGSPNEEMFTNHRWVRYRNFMASFEDLSRRFARSRRSSDDAAQARGKPSITRIIDGDDGGKIGYPAPREARPYYVSVTKDLETLALSMAEQTRRNANATFDLPRHGSERTKGGSAPWPTMRSRLRPSIDNDPRSGAADLPDPL
ncbi:hypothetical protein RPMA_11280 [Tardiphaga alba]|uniref:PNPLA domain-containing protein n=1 Tax=Tardiphaga alba TaxID=340268 RepID=A0ABX8A6Q6_9BRAD|nr:patatin-like phospholipase family protein [Tardiphaga alba]QUS39354.1 hypothetical protein RPMA_11280 [Tardiphaga alba]